MLKKCLKFDKIFLRLVASWLILNIINSFANKFNYNLEFGQNINIIVLISEFLSLFLIMTLISRIFKEKDIDFYIAIISFVISSVIWVNKNHDIYFLTVLFLLFLLFYRYKKINLEKEISNKKTIILVIIMGISMFLCIAIIGTMSYISFGSPNFDMGIPAQNFYYMKKTLIPFSTCERDILISHFMIHVSPIYYLILPFYYIFSSPITLQVASAVVIALGILPLYLICKNHKFSNIVTACICLIYSLSTVAIASTFYDFHENHFLIVLLLFLFYAYEKHNKPLFIISALLTLFVKEDAAAYLVIFGIYMLFDNRKKGGIILILTSLTYFVGTNLFLTTFGEGVMSDRYNNLIYESGLFGLVKTILVNPGYFISQLTTSAENNEKIRYLLQLFIPLGFVPFMSKKFKNFILLLPLLLTTMTTYLYSYNIDFQYSCGIAAFLFYLLILNIEEIKNKSYLVVCIIGSLLVFSNHVYPSLRNSIKNYQNNLKMYAKLEAFINQIPADKSVSAPSFLVAHLANRDEVYETYYHDHKVDVDFVIVDKNSNEGKTDYNIYKTYGYYEYDTYDGSLVILAKKKIS